MLIRYWSEFLGVQIGSSEDSSSPEETEIDIVWHKGLEGFNGLFIFRHAKATIVSAPPEKLRFAVLRFSDPRSLKAFEADAVRAALGSSVAEITGPTILFYADAESLRQPPGPDVRPLEESDFEAYKEFLDGEDPADVQASGLNASSVNLFGCFLEGQLVSAAGYDVWGSVIGNLGVLTMKSCRKNGLALVTMAAAARDGIERGLVMQYRAPANGDIASHLARRLGFEEFARTISVDFVKPPR